MAKVSWDGAKWGFTCSACGVKHYWDERAMFNGDVNRPTVAPEIDWPATGCRLLLSNGVAHYLLDCRHPLAGKFVELPQIER